MSTILTLEMMPAIEHIWRGKHPEEWVKWPKLPRERREDLSHQFVSGEKEVRQTLATPTTEAKP
ncbi:MAG: hypothetical protein JNN01_09810 [Opitutaceae bacterium]|nr:hypothetical protein [Opitutaceae bacterium]